MDVKKKKDKKTKHKKDRAAVVENETMAVDSPGTLLETTAYITVQLWHIVVEDSPNPDKKKRKRNDASASVSSESKKDKKKRRKSLEASPDEAPDVVSEEHKEKKHKKDKKRSKEAGSTGQSSPAEPAATSSGASSKADINAFLQKNSITIHGTTPLTPILSFDELDIPDSLRVAFDGFKEPTPIQTCSWPAALAGQDVVGIAETGR